MTSGIGIPVVSDVTFRISENGDMIGIDFECLDGAVRSVALPISDLSKIFAGFLWAGDESAQRRFPGPVDTAMREQLRDGARPATDFRIVDVGGEQFAEITIGAAHLCVRLPRGN